MNPVGEEAQEERTFPLPQGEDQGEGNLLSAAI